MGATINFIHPTTNVNSYNDQVIKNYYFTDNLILNSITFPLSNPGYNFKHTLAPATLEKNTSVNYTKFFFQLFADIYPRIKLKPQLNKESSYLFPHWLLTSKLNSYTTIVFIGMLLLYQLYLYDFNLAEYFL